MTFYLLYYKIILISYKIYFKFWGGRGENVEKIGLMAFILSSALYAEEM